jgi:hypothetical protein
LRAADLHGYHWVQISQVLSEMLTQFERINSDSGLIKSLCAYCLTTIIANGANALEIAEKAHAARCKQKEG